MGQYEQILKNRKKKKRQKLEKSLLLSRTI